MSKNVIDTASRHRHSAQPNKASPWKIQPPLRDEHPGMLRSSDAATVENTGVTPGTYPGAKAPGEPWESVPVERRRRGVR